MKEIQGKIIVGSGNQFDTGLLGGDWPPSADKGNFNYTAPLNDDGSTIEMTVDIKATDASGAYHHFHGVVNADGQFFPTYTIDKTGGPPTPGGK